MPIPLIHEDDCDMSLAEAFNVSNLIEKCHFCDQKTRFWHQATNMPVCPGCAKVRKVSELPKDFAPSEPEPVKKALKADEIALRESDDELYLQQRELEKQLTRLQRKRVAVQDVMKAKKMTIKRPVYDIPA